MTKLKEESKHNSRYGRREVRLSRHKGQFFKKCPGSPGQVCCGYWVLNIVHNCPFDCVYCILQSYLDSRTITVYVNIEDAIEELRQVVSDRPETIYRVGTGELADSLATEPLVPLSRELIRSTAEIDNLYLELKTKSANVGGLIGLEHGGRVIVSWTLGPDFVVREYEPGTMSLSRRLEAARRVQDDGYLLGFHFDPIIRYEGWEDDYRRLIDALFDTIDPDRVVWISLGCLRYPPALKEIALDRLDRTRIFLDEFVPCPDGKMRYLRPVREEIYRKVGGWLREGAPSVELYLCMESTLVWKNVFDLTPEGENWLSERLDRAVSRK